MSTPIVRQKRYPDVAEVAYTSNSMMEGPSGKYLTNYKAEAEALRTAASILTDNMEAIHTTVIFSHALSVIQALPNPRNKNLNDLAAAVHALQQSTEKTVIQQILSHCNFPGNTEVDRLAKEGGEIAVGKAACWL